MARCSLCGQACGLDMHGQRSETHTMMCLRLRRLERAVVEAVQTSLTAAWSPELRELAREIERDLREEDGGG